MATTADLLLDILSRVRENVHSVLESTPGDRLAIPPAPGTNTIAWLVWHLTRVLDEQVAEVFGYPAVWEAGGWRERLALPVPPDAHGYGMAYEEEVRSRRHDPRSHRVMREPGDPQPADGAVQVRVDDDVAFLRLDVHRAQVEPGQASRDLDTGH